MIYLDTAALVKLVHEEPCSDELRVWINAQPTTPMVSSALAEVELPRALRRNAPEALPSVAALLDRLYRVEIDRTIRKLAAEFANPQLRSLDAIHLATAELLFTESHGALTYFVSYDRRLLAAAEDCGLKAESPGQSRD